MTTYIALLRGINVGGKNMIKMAELRQALGAIGLSEVQTYIQSGNVLFKSDEGEETIRENIIRTIELSFGFSVPVVLRTVAELEQIIQRCPFTAKEIAEAEAASEAESLYVSFLTHIPAPEKIERLNTYKSDNEEYRIIGRDVFLLFRYSIRNSKLANNLQKLDVSATVRNWNTIIKLNELAKAMVQ